MKTITEYLVNNHINYKGKIHSEEDLYPGCYWHLEIIANENKETYKYFGRLDSENMFSEDGKHYHQYYYCDYSWGVYYEVSCFSIKSGKYMFSTITDAEYKLCLQIEDYIKKNKNRFQNENFKYIGDIVNGTFVPAIKN